MNSTHTIIKPTHVGGGGSNIGYGEGITNTESPIKIGGCTKELSIGGGTKSEGYLD